MRLLDGSANATYGLLMLINDIRLSRGQYSDAVLSELEGQNDAQVEGISAKVKMLKDVRHPPILPILPDLIPPAPLSHPPSNLFGPPRSQ